MDPSQKAYSRFTSHVGSTGLVPFFLWDPERPQTSAGHRFEARGASASARAARRSRAELKELALRSGVGGGETEVRARVRGRHAPARRAREESLVDQVGLDHVLERALVLADRGGERLEAGGPAVEPLDRREEQRAVEPVEAGGVDVEPLEREARPRGLDAAPGAGLHLGEVAHAPQQAVRDARGAARAPRDLAASVRGE